MILCPACGNKRCPRATDHRFACTGSNEPGQFGSNHGGYPSVAAELTERNTELNEIRRMLGLGVNLSHEMVMARLHQIGRTDRRIDLDALPKRYEHAIWAYKGVGTP